MKPALKIVVPEPEVVDIYAAWKADIARIDWRRTHIAADKRIPVEIVSPRRTWRG